MPERYAAGSHETELVDTEFILPSLEFNGGSDVFVKAKDRERIIAAHVMGPDYGVPVFYLAGNPSSRKGPNPSIETLLDLCVRLITVDAPGLGDTTRKPGLAVADAASDIEDVADHLGVEKFAVMGRSGGGPRAMACAALLPDRVTALQLLATYAPHDADIDWLGGNTTSDNRRAFMDNPDTVYATRRQIATALHADSRSHMETLIPQLTGEDAHYPSAILDEIARGHAEGIADGDGWADLMLSIAKPWGFNVEDIEAPCVIWHGANDPFIDINHGQWLSRHIPRAVFYEDDIVSHLSMAFYSSEAIRRVRNMHFGPRDDSLLQARRAMEYKRICEEPLINTVDLNRVPLGEMSRLPAARARAIALVALSERISCEEVEACLIGPIGPTDPERRSKYIDTYQDDIEVRKPQPRSPWWRGGYAGSI